MISVLQALEELLALSESMLSAAGTEDWETLASLEAARRALTESLPAGLTADLPAGLQARARVLIENCLRCDENLRPLLDARMNELQVVLRAAQPAI
jgi:hypothetical protein